MPKKKKIIKLLPCLFSLFFCVYLGDVRLAKAMFSNNGRNCSEVVKVGKEKFSFAKVKTQENGVRKTKRNNMATIFFLFISCSSVLKSLNFASLINRSSHYKCTATTQIEDSKPWPCMTNCIDCMMIIIRLQKCVTLK